MHAPERMLKNFHTRRDVLLHLDQARVLPFRLHEVIEGWPVPSTTSQRQKRKACDNEEEDRTARMEEEEARVVKRLRTRVLEGEQAARDLAAMLHHVP